MTTTDLVYANIFEDTYMGPVHDVQMTKDYLAILVPFVHSYLTAGMQDVPELVWVSVYCAHNGRRDYSRL